MGASYTVRTETDNVVTCGTSEVATVTDGCIAGVHCNVTSISWGAVHLIN